MLHALVRPRALGAAHVARLLVRHRPDRGRDGPSGLRSPAHALGRARLARDLLHDRHGTLANERDGHRVGAHAVARDAAGGVGRRYERSMASDSAHGSADWPGASPRSRASAGYFEWRCPFRSTPAEESRPAHWRWPSRATSSSRSSFTPGRFGKRNTSDSSVTGVLADGGFSEARPAAPGGPRE